MIAFAIGIIGLTWAVLRLMRQQYAPGQVRAALIVLVLLVHVGAWVLLGSQLGGAAYSFKTVLMLWYPLAAWKYLSWANNSPSYWYLRGRMGFWMSTTAVISGAFGFSVVAAGIANVMSNVILAAVRFIWQVIG